MLSLTEVRRAAAVLEMRLEGKSLQRVVQPDDFRIALEFYGRGATLFVLLSCRPRFAHVGIVPGMPKAPAAPPAFAQYLRAHLGRARFVTVSTSLQDRRLGIRLDSQEGEVEVLLSILGNRSNVYLLDRKGILLFALRSPEVTRRELIVGESWIDPQGMPKSAGADRWHEIPAERYLEAVAAEYETLERREESAVLARRLEQALRKESEFLERKAVNILQDLGDALQAEQDLHKGELLKIALHRVCRGDSSVAVNDPASGETVEIELDPRLSPTENLQLYFKRYQKELRGASALRRQLETVRSDQEALSLLQRRLQDTLAQPAPDLDAFRALATEPRLRRLIARHAPAGRLEVPRVGKQQRSRSEIPARLRPKRYRTGQGLEIWVGRSDEGNDYLTTRLARGNDLFFHLEGYPGSHVILKTEGKSAPPVESILDACELAVHFSRLKDVRRADVHVAPVKNVRKPRGAKPGLVMVTGGKSIHLRRDQARLENILATRLDE